jgi:antitoxin MazE
MADVVRSKVIKIGNSRGIRIPKTLLEQAGLTDEVEMRVEDNKLVIQPASSSRLGWDSQFASMSVSGDDRLLDEGVSTRWDEEEWEW